MTSLYTPGATDDLVTEALVQKSDMPMEVNSQDLVCKPLHWKIVWKMLSTSRGEEVLASLFVLKATQSPAGPTKGIILHVRKAQDVLSVKGSS